MKDSGLICTVEKNGAVYLPKKVRGQIGLEIKSEAVIDLDEDMIVIRSNDQGCVFCKDEYSSFTEHKGKLICNDCKENLVGESDKNG